MQTKFKRHEVVKILRIPDTEYIEYNPLHDDSENIEIKVGMSARINILLPNGQYHVEIMDEKGEIFAYVPMSEDDLEKVE